VVVVEGLSLESSAADPQKSKIRKFARIHVLSPRGRQISV
jgi:hypothetical protein